MRPAIQAIAPVAVGALALFLLGASPALGIYVCGDGICQSWGIPPETPANCQADCGYCGDGICGWPDTCSTCSTDCGACADPGCPLASSNTIYFNCVSTPSCATSTDGDCDGIPDATENRLANKFAPLFYHDSYEENMPSSVEWYFDRVHMRIHHDDGCGDDQIIDKGCVTVTNACGFGHKTKGGWPFCGHQSSYRYSNAFYPSGEQFFLQIPNDSSEQLTRLGDWSAQSWTCYARVRESLVSAAAWDIQYWMFYPYNGLSLGEHEGDWEHLTVTVNCDESLHSVFYAAHDYEGRRFYPGQFSLVAGSHPKSFVADGSHANYPSPGVHTRGLLPNDYHNGLGAVLDCRNLVVNVGEAGKPLNGNSWMLYGGLWGEVGASIGHSNSGPHGPPFKTVDAAFWTACEDCPASTGCGACGESSCTPINSSYISHFTGPDCTGEEHYYTPYFNYDGVRRSWDGQGCAGTVLRTVTNRSYKNSSGVCYNAWPAGNTLSNFVKVYRVVEECSGECPNCGESSCAPVEDAYISHFTGSNCTGEEHYYTPYFFYDGVRRSWDGQGCAGTVLRTVTNRSYKSSSGVCYNAWPSGNTLSDFVKIYR